MLLKLSFPKLFMLALLCTALTATTVGSLQAAETQAKDPHAKHRAMMEKSQAAEAVTSDVDLRDNSLITRHGDVVRFKTDVVGDRIVVIDFIYTTCTTVCPVLSAVFQQVQQGLDADAEVGLVSISVDPLRDTPQRLFDYAERLGAGDNWIWLTGEKTTVDDVLRGLGAYTPDFEDHPAMVLVGDPQSGTWKRFFGFPSPKKILTAVDEMTANRKMANAQP